MSEVNPTTEIAMQTLAVAADVATGNWGGALISAKRLVAMIEAYIVPPIEAHSLDPINRAEIDAEVDAEVSKT